MCVIDHVREYDFLAYTVLRSISVYCNKESVGFDYLELTKPYFDTINNNFARAHSRSAPKI